MCEGTVGRKKLVYVGLWCVRKPKGSPREAQGESKGSPRKAQGKYSFGKLGGGGDGKEKFRKTERATTGAKGGVSAYATCAQRLPH